MKSRQPLFHVVKRDQAGPGRQLAAYVAAVVLALAVGAVLLLIITVAAASDIPPIAGAHVIDVHNLRARMEHGEDA